MQERGDDATGVGLVNTATGSLVVYKNGIKATDFIQEDGLDKVLIETEYNLVLLHTRAWTNGTPTDNRNNHPIYDSKTNEAVVHNGVIYIPKELEDKIKCDGICDSEYILRLTQKYGVVKGLKKINGNMAIALWGKHLHLYTNSNPLTLAYLPKRDLFVFASLKEYITDVFSYNDNTAGFFGFKKFRKQEEMNDYEFYVNDFLTVNFGKQNLSLSDVKVSTERLWKTGTVTVGRVNGGPAYNGGVRWSTKIQAWVPTYLGEDEIKEEDREKYLNYCYYD
jgi:hypothetical protein